MTQRAPASAQTRLAAAPARTRSIAWLPGRITSGLSTPAKLRLALAAAVAVSVLWGAAAAWSVSQRISAADDVVASSEPLSFDAQQIYQALSDADATEAAAFLAGTEPPAARSRYLADIARAATYLEVATAAAGTQGTGSSGLITLSTGIPVYTGLVDTARADNRLGLPVGASYLTEASALMRAKLLPAADSFYQQENTRLAATYSQAIGPPFLAVVVAIVAGCVLFGVQRWETGRTHRSFNYGLVAASVAGVISLTWLIAGLTVARVQLLDASDHGSVPVEALAQADIAALRAHADESLTLINRSGDDANQADFLRVEKQLGPGPGTLLTDAAAAAAGSPGAQPAAAATAAATAWYATHRQVRALDDGGNYNAAVQLAIGPEPASSSGMFTRLETSLTKAISADQAVFSSAARTGQDAMTGLEAGMIVISLVMATGCAWGLNRRLAEYR
jgi:hypothetical protein